MAQSDRERWNKRYAEPVRPHKDGPHAVLTRFAPPAVPGCRALELACGLGRDAIWLAEQGYTVDAIDISQEALRQARAAARQCGVIGLTFILADLDHFPLPDYAYDLVMVFRFLDRALFPAIRDRVRPGGMIIYETLNVGRLDQAPDTSPDHMLRRGELPEHFPGWTVLEARDDAFTSRLVALKPG